ncbi:MAG: hypothetical protein ABIJ41_05745 [Candidatus Omnitrophota bacterium]
MVVDRRLVIFSLFLLTSLAYGNTLFNDFVWDDQAFIVKNPFIRHFKYISDFFHKNLNDLSSWGRGFDIYYRPLFLMSFMLDYQLWDLNPFFFHLHNVFLHFLCAVLIFYFAREIFEDDFFATVSAILFCLHPLHTEPVSAVFNRRDIVVTCLMLGSFLSYAKFLKGQKNKIILYGLSLVLFFIALLTKELAVMLPFILLTYDYYFVERNAKNLILHRWPYIFGFGIVLTIYVSMRMAVLNQFTLGYTQKAMYSSFQYTDFPLLQIYIIFQSLFVYFSKVALPINLNLIIPCGLATGIPYVGKV